MTRCQDWIRGMLRQIGCPASSARRGFGWCCLRTRRTGRSPAPMEWARPPSPTVSPCCSRRRRPCLHAAMSQPTVEHVLLSLAIALLPWASVDDTNRRLKGGVVVGAGHFRPNVHVSGCSAWEEDEMPSLAFRGPSPSSPSSPPLARFRLVKPCSRCTVPTVNPWTAEREASGEPLKLLRRFRAAELLRHSARLHKAFYSRPELAGEAYFGQNVLVEMPSAGVFLSVGDVAEVEW
mmetsp:Transcript_24879/g.82946  ORF Transcript_24879/g.82946 Transcript_24879/m.82946 type:complete len:235 (+) Transcript_24879:553-1257(+)